MASQQALRTHLALLAVASLAALAACAPAGPEAGDGDGDGGKCEVRSLLVGTIEGNPHGEGEKYGSEAAVRRINAAGGVNGCTLVLDIKDDGGDFTKTLPVTQAAMQDHHYAHVNVTGYGAPSVQPYLVSQQQFAITTLGVKGAFDPARAKYQFDNISLTADTAGIVAEKLVESGAKNVGIIVDNTAVGASTRDAVTEVVEDAQGKVAAVESVDASAVDLTPVVQRLKAAGADTLFIDLNAARLGYAIRDIKASNWDVPIYLGQTAYVTDLASLVPEKDYVGILSAGPAGLTSPPNPGVQDLVDDAIANGASSIGTQLAGVLWSADSLTLFAWAANGAKSTEAADMARFLEENGDVDVPGLAMATQTGFSAENHEWKAKDGIALVDVAPRDEFGRYPSRIELLTVKG